MDGLFSPDSITWRVHADPLMAVGGLRALLLQALHPVPMAIFERTSDFRGDFWGRLMRTADYVGVVTYGTTAEAEALLARVRRVHAHLPSVDVDDAERRASEPELLLWVHACLVDSFLTAVRRGGLRLTDAEADQYVAEQAVLAGRVGVEGLPVPRTTAELAAYLTGMRPHLRATPAARSGIRTLLVPPVPTPALPAVPVWSTLVWLAAATLPRWARRAYGLPGLPATDLATTAGLRALRTSLAVVPGAWREGPHRAAARQRLAAG